MQRKVLKTCPRSPMDTKPMVQPRFVRIQDLADRPLRTATWTRIWATVSPAQTITHFPRIVETNTELLIVCTETPTARRAGATNA